MQAHLTCNRNSAAGKLRNKDGHLWIDQDLRILKALAHSICDFGQIETRNVQRACKRQQDIALQVYPEPSGEFRCVEDHNIQQIAFGDLRHRTRLRDVGSRSKQANAALVHRSRSRRIRDHTRHLLGIAVRSLATRLTITIRVAGTTDPCRLCRAAQRLWCHFLTQRLSLDCGYAETCHANPGTGHSHTRKAWRQQFT
jgi:hypothetical protein